MEDSLHRLGWAGIALAVSLSLVTVPVDAKPPEELLHGDEEDATVDVGVEVDGEVDLGARVRPPPSPGAGDEGSSGPLPEERSERRRPPLVDAPARPPRPPRPPREATTLEPGYREPATDESFDFPLLPPGVVNL